MIDLHLNNLLQKLKRSIRLLILKFYVKYGHSIIYAADKRAMLYIDLCLTGNGNLYALIKCEYEKCFQNPKLRLKEDVSLDCHILVSYCNIFQRMTDLQ